jgi:hypothetical protein
VLVRHQQPPRRVQRHVGGAQEGAAAGAAVAQPVRATRHHAASAAGRHLQHPADQAATQGL